MVIVWWFCLSVLKKYILLPWPILRRSLPYRHFANAFKGTLKNVTRLDVFSTELRTGTFGKFGFERVARVMSGGVRVVCVSPSLRFIQREKNSKSLTCKFNITDAKLYIYYLLFLHLLWDSNGILYLMLYVSCLYFLGT